MDIHQGDRTIKISLTEMDSITFSSGAGAAPAGVRLSMANVGADAGGDLWNVQMTAMVVTAEDDPVEDGWTVEFTIEQDIATVVDAMTGDENFEGNTSPGVAFTTLTYASEYSLDSITVTATIRQYEEVTTTEDFILPLNDPEISVFADPANWNFRHQTNPAVFAISALVVDGHNVEISDVLVRFYTTCGSYYNVPTGGAEVNEAITGPANYPQGRDADEQGWAQRYLRVSFDDAFPDPRILESAGFAWAGIVGPGNVISDTLTIQLLH
ncbi:MAG: hypothetical protein RAP03_01305 [Candidatus Electryonea clarkiae]|nr:hypothetical protein [Candidatus Electryonea clarkiae]